MNHNITSADDYAQLLIDGILEVENETPVNERLDPKLLEYWFKGIRNAVDISYNEYIIGKREDYMLDTEEMERLFNEAHQLNVDDTLTSMLEKGLLSLSIGENGDILYSLSDEGKELAEQLKMK